MSRRIADHHLLYALGAATLIFEAACHAAPPRVDLASVARTWTDDFSVQGTKTEATFVERVQYARTGDEFSLRASIYGQDVGVRVLRLDQAGRLSVIACPSQSCDSGPPNGFLATAAMLSALRSGRLGGQGDVVAYAGRDAVCVPLEQLEPDLAEAVVLDPCFDRQTGAVLAHRRRFDGQFGGATLDESSISLRIGQPSSSSARPTPGSFEFSV